MTNKSVTKWLVGIVIIAIGIMLVGFVLSLFAAFAGVSSSAGFLPEDVGQTLGIIFAVLAVGFTIIRLLISIGIIASVPSIWAMFQRKQKEKADDMDKNEMFP